MGTGTGSKVVWSRSCSRGKSESEGRVEAVEWHCKGKQKHVREQKAIHKEASLYNQVLEKTKERGSYVGMQRLTLDLS